MGCRCRLPRSPHEGTASVLLGQAGETFASNVTYPVGGSPRSVASGDVDGNGWTNTGGEIVVHVNGTLSHGCFSACAFQFTS